MELGVFLADLQAAYVAEFKATVAQEKAVNAETFSEVAFEVSGSVYRSLYVVDMVRREASGDVAVEVSAVTRSLRGSASFHLGNMQVRSGSVSWDAVRVEGAPSGIDLAGFDAWFSRWLDVDKEPAAGEGVTGIIHSAILEAEAVQVDFGTAPPQAAVELLELFGHGGAERVTLSSSRK